MASEDDDTYPTWSAGDVASFPMWLAEKGYLAKPTAQSYRRAVVAVFEHVEGEGWETADLQSADMDDLLGRFEQKATETRQLTPESIATYLSRFRKASTLYADYQRDRTLPRPTRRERSLGGGRSGKQASRTGAANGERSHQSGGTTAAETAWANSSGVEMVSYPLPVRPGVRATLVLPEDLTRKEAERIAQYVAALPMDEGGPTDEADDGSQSDERG